MLLISGACVDVTSRYVSGLAVSISLLNVENPKTKKKKIGNLRTNVMTYFDRTGVSVLVFDLI